MKYQSFIMRVLCLILIIGAVLGYNSMQKKDSDTKKDQQIASLTTRVEALEKQQDEILSAIEEAAKAQEEAKKKAEEEAKNKKDSAAKEDADTADKAEEEQDDADSEEDSSEKSEDLAYKNGTYTGDGQGFGGNIQVQVTLENDTITDIQVVSAPGEDSAYLSQGQGVISTILAAQSTDVDTISGATFSSTGIINAVNDALGKAENQ
nr:FMN-binding protein [uncultured Blautia sp.]